MKTGIIGGGLGGLASAALLASKGHEVTLFEQNKNPGGKMNIIDTGEFRFDTGPSLLTMPSVLEDIFTKCGKRMSDYITLKKLSPLCRYFFNDGIRFDCYSDIPETLSEIDKFAPEDRQAYVKFLGYSADLYDKTARAFLFNPLENISDLKGLNLMDFLKINPFQTVSQSVDRYFKSPYLRKFFKRFTTYNGSSPFQAPATLNVIPFVELCLGGYYVEGGMYNIADALYQLGMEFGVDFNFNTTIQKIEVSKQTCTALIDAHGNHYSFDTIISNSDATNTYLHLIDKKHLPEKLQKKHRNLEPSCSGFVLLLGIDRQYHMLEHHNVFFASDYEAEFKAIFKSKTLFDDPTIYIANTSVSNATDAIEGGSNLFILVNAPYLSHTHDWPEAGKKWKKTILNKLKAHGLEDIERHIKYQRMLTPLDFKQKYASNQGSIYGTSSNSKWAAFIRPQNRSIHLDNLYLVGGSTHPGGGIPLVLLSALNVNKMI